MKITEVKVSKKYIEFRISKITLDDVCLDCTDFLNHPCVECVDCPVKRLKDRFKDAYAKNKQTKIII